jgi:hypothetical protein
VLPSIVTTFVYFANVNESNSSLMECIKIRRNSFYACSYQIVINESVPIRWLIMHRFLSVS